ncbi:50S ribosomal protein L23 [Pyrobaculum neutrophilum]|uniref:Large ribosomal subunit protein uL23 n=1 Tax=Pyrobaculum neutrophilum (strain DSM 2338 / JCM 9278 / NBRC 100436 / V24Sta) TaxID=444157 RepID=B1YD90_PYRNV|nr:50S ribosomal protein L23 [Pyrobaculum neutrophilum]ACB39753.1 Ribosomal protein L25/L23 [Pyrobaculum neutrophilum V24Sta]
MIKRFVVTEKALRLAERENKLTVVVDRSATKKQIADEIQRLYNVKVEKVNTVITAAGEKKAYVKLEREYNAIDLLSKLGVL